MAATTTSTMDEDKSVATGFTTSTYSMCRGSQEIRSRLLSRLGIFDQSSVLSTSPPQTQPMTAAQHRRVRILRNMGIGYATFQSPPDGSALRKPLNNVLPSKEPLKVDYDVMEEKEEVVEVHNNKTKKTTRIAFQDEVDVLPIPTRHEYSDRIKSRIWSNRHELQENAQRNAVEFAAEGWNWETVTEDEGMYVCLASGELVHPAWVGDIPRLERGSAAHASTSSD
jgi:hypothetical protein